MALVVKDEPWTSERKKERDGRRGGERQREYVLTKLVVNLRGCAKAKTLSVLAAYSSISSWWVIPGSSGWSACTPYMSINFDIGGILGNALPVIFGACFRPNLFKICSFIASRLRALISSCILHALHPLLAWTIFLDIFPSIFGASKAPSRTSESSSTLVIIFSSSSLFWRTDSSFQSSTNQIPSSSITFFHTSKIAQSPKNFYSSI